MSSSIYPMVTEGGFREELRRIDVLCDIDFESLPYGIRVTPSDPSYREMLTRRAMQLRPMGVALEVATLVFVAVQDRDWLPIRAPKLTLWQHIKQWWKERG